MTFHRTSEYRDPPEYYVPVPKWQPTMVNAHSAMYTPYSTLDDDKPIDGAGEISLTAKRKCRECGAPGGARKCRRCGANP